MLYSSTRTRRLPTALVAGAIVMLLVGAGAATISAFDRDNTPAPARPAAASTPPTTSVDVAAPTPVARTAGGELAPVAESRDPVAFARSAALALFEWDTTAPVALADHKGRLLVVADPSGVESPGLISDLARYLPNSQAWTHLRQYDTRQWLEVTGAVVPNAWTDAIDQAPDVVAPGTFAVTITGVRHRAGRWDGQTVVEEFDVAFTVFVGCEPTYPTCYLLRLTQLDKPLR